MATCTENSSGAACQKAMNERDAVGLALATGTVALLSGSAQVMWGLGASANAGISYLADGTVDPANAAIAGWVNVFSMGNGLAGTVGWNAAGGALVTGSATKILCLVQFQMVSVLLLGMVSVKVLLRGQIRLRML